MGNSFFVLIFEEKTDFFSTKAADVIFGGRRNF